MKVNPPESPVLIELSRPLEVARISSGGIQEQMVARPDERVNLAKRFGLLELSSLTADLNVDLVRAGKMVSVKGSFEADIIQECVVTLEPIKSHLSEKIDVLFAPPALLEPSDGSTLHNDVDEADAPEPIENGVIDLGEVVSQQLGISLDPYPRLPGATLPSAYVADKEEKLISINPFVQLKERVLSSKDDKKEE